MMKVIAKQASVSLRWYAFSVGIFLLLTGVSSPAQSEMAPAALFEIVPYSASARTANPGRKVEAAPTGILGVRLRADTLSSLQRGSRLGLRITVDQSVTGLIQNVHTTLLGRRVITGRLVDPVGGSFTVVVNARGQEAVGTIHLAGGQLYTLGRAPGGSTELQVRRQATPNDSCGAAEAPATLIKSTRTTRHQAVATTRHVSSADPSNQYDLLIVYTAQAKDYVGGQEAIELLCEERVETANQAYVNSNLDMHARLVHTMETSYQQVGDVVQDLHKFAPNGALDANADPAIPEALDQYGADFLSLIVDTHSHPNSASGVAVFGGDISVCTAGLTFSTLAHEVGHNMGCNHDRPYAYPNPDGASYAYGWSWTGRDGVVYGDIMSYTGSKPFFVFSNPQVLYQGVPTGDPARADNARVIRESAPFFCNNRHATVAARPRVSLSLVQPEAIKETGQPALLKVTRASTDLSQALDVHLIMPDSSVPDPGVFTPIGDYADYGHPAVAGKDFTAPPATLTIPVGEASVTVSIPPIANPNRVLDTDAPRAAALILAEDAAYDMGLPSAVTLRVYEHALKVSLQVRQPVAVQNPSQAAVIVATRTGTSAFPDDQPLPIAIVRRDPYGFQPSTAVEGVDYTITPDSNSPAAVIPAGKTSATFSINVLPGATLPAGGKALYFVMDSPADQNVYHYDPTQRAVLSLQPVPLTVNAGPLDVASVSVKGPAVAVEGGAPVKLVFSRTGINGNLGSALQISYSVSGKAGAGSRVDLSSGSVVIPARASKIKVKLRALDDGAVETNQIVKVKVESSSDYTVGTPNKVKVVVSDPSS